jgi:2-methylcitrate dehydratase PrpD
VAAALTQAEAADASGRALLEAVTAGIEAATRIYNAVYPTLKGRDKCGMSPVSVANAVGAAAAAACGGPILPEHSEECLRYLAQPAVAGAYAKISVVPDGDLTHYHQARVRVELADGRVLDQAACAPRGTPGNPLSDDDVRAKFIRLAAPVLGPGAAESVRSVIEGVGDAPDLRQMFGWLRAETPAGLGQGNPAHFLTANPESTGGVMPVT